jgi:Icc-related predicted phosphoesterase
MKILVMGDLHGAIPKKIPKNVDLILCTGDLGKATLARKRFFENAEREKKGLPILEENKSFVKAVHDEIHNSTLNVLNYLSKIAFVYTISGNVGVYGKSDSKTDYNKYKIKLSSTLDELKKIKRINLVKNSVRNLNGLKVGFLEYFVDSSWAKEFKPEDKKLKNSSRKISSKREKILKRFGDLDILVCHQPPYGVLDKVGNLAPKMWQGKHAGSKVILNYIKKYQPRYVFCGHIHEGRGKAKIGKSIVYNCGSDGDYVFVDIK